MSGATWTLGDLIMNEGHSRFHWYETEAAPGLDPRRRFSVMVTESDGWHSSPPVRAAATPRPGADGVHDGPIFYNGRTVTVLADVEAVSERELLAARDFILPIAKHPTRLSVEEPGASVRSMMVRQAAEPRFRPLSPTHAELQLQLFAPDPFKYSYSWHEGTTGLPAFGDGWSYNYTYDYAYGAPGTAGTVRATNAGNQPSWPQFVINGPVVDPTVTLAGEARVLSMQIVLSETDELVVDTHTRTIILNGTASRRNARAARSDWWPLAPGDNDILFGARSSVGGAALTVRWKDAWI